MTDRAIEGVTVTVLDVLPQDLRDAVERLVGAATKADGVAPLSEQVMLRLRGAGGGRHLIARTDAGRVAGYARCEPVDPADPARPIVAEIVVDPDHRRRGVGRTLLRTLAASAPGPLTVWAHGDLPAARALGRELGLREVRRLEQLRRPLPPGPAEPGGPAPTLPDGVALRDFRPGEDDEAWLALNARAFAHHPEQGAWTIEDLRVRLRESWFDASLFLLAVEGDAMVGFHWIKVHDEGGDRPLGEVYVLGVDPGMQGRGLGRALTIAGLDRMRARGLTRAMLYVEGDNAPAQATYRGLGFTLWHTDILYSGRPAS